MAQCIHATCMGQTGGSPSSSIGEDTKAGSNEGHGGLGLEGGDPSSAQSAETYVVQGILYITFLL